MLLGELIEKLQEIAIGQGTIFPVHLYIDGAEIELSDVIISSDGEVEDVVLLS
jgi:hypothetical protein